VTTPNPPAGQDPPPVTPTSTQPGGSIRARLASPGPGFRSGAGATHQGSAAAAPATAETRSELTRPEPHHGADVDPDEAFARERRHELDPQAARVAERKVAALFVLSFLSVIAFVVWYVVGESRFGVPNNRYYTPVLGVLMALALGGIGTGTVLWAKLLMVDEEAVQERHPFGSPAQERAATAQALKQGLADTGLGRRSLLRNTLLLGAGSLAILPVPLLLGLGRFQNKESVLASTLWAKGVRLMRENGTPVRVGDLQIGGVESVFPDVAGGLRAADSPALLIRMRPDQLQLPTDRASWTYEGHLAYSSICTHLGCPVKLYEQQTRHLFCPCHQSTFDASRAAKVLFGPAVRPLPMLAISVDAEGYFVAQGDFAEPVGSSYWERSS